MNYQIEKTNGVSIVSFNSSPTLADAKAVVDTLQQDDAYHFRLWDFSEAVVDFGTKEVQEIADYGKVRFKEKNRNALVAPGDLSFGTLRMFEAYREEESFAIARVFRTRDEAFEWLIDQQHLLAQE